MPKQASTGGKQKLGAISRMGGKMMLGHVRAGISDIYAIRDIANLRLALSATESIIEEIETLAPGAFNRDFTAATNKLEVAA